MGCSNTKAADDDSDTPMGGSSNGGGGRVTQKSKAKGEVSFPGLQGKDSTDATKYGRLPAEAKAITAKDQRKHLLNDLTGVMRYQDDETEVEGSMAVTRQRIMVYLFAECVFNFKCTDSRIRQIMWMWETDAQGENAVFIMQTPAKFIDKDYDGDLQIRWQTDEAQELCNIISNLHNPDPEPVVKTGPDVALYRDRPPL